MVRRRRLPPPASANVYELTEWGAELEPILLGLQRWGAASPSYPHDLPVGCDAAMLALKNSFDPHAEPDLSVTVKVRFATDRFRLFVDHGSLDIARGSAPRPDVVIETDPGTLEALAFAGLPLGDAEQAGSLSIDGDRAHLERLLECFSAPV